MAGIATMEDVIETMLGLEIVDESDRNEDMQLLARKNWQQRAKRLGLIEERPASVEDKTLADDSPVPKG
jgi:CBS domain containing-hemolysin-like protein